MQQLLTRSKHGCLIGLGRSSDEEDDLEFYPVLVMAKVEHSLWIHMGEAEHENVFLLWVCGKVNTNVL